MTPTDPDRWRTSSVSQEGQCVQVTTWRRATASTQHQACVELAVGGGPGDALLGVRDSKSPTTGALVLPDRARTALVSFVRTSGRST